MMYEIWSMQGPGFKIKSFDDFETARHQAEILMRQMSVLIKRDDGAVYDWKEKRFYKPPPKGK